VDAERQQARRNDDERGNERTASAHETGSLLE
jgi:hypothetical protein